MFSSLWVKLAGAAAFIGALAAAFFGWRAEVRTRAKVEVRAAAERATRRVHRRAVAALARAEVKHAQTRSKPINAESLDNHWPD